MEYVAIKKKNDDELMHYGVLGMKWGIHKGRVSASTQRVVGRRYSDKVKKRMTKQAVKILEKDQRRFDTLSQQHENRAKRAKNDIAARNDLNASKFEKTMSKMREKTLKDIDEGKIKAGRDFVVNSTYSTSLPLDAIGFINLRTERDIDFKH